MIDVSTSTKTLPIVMSPIYSEVRGELVSVLLAGDGCIVAAFACSCSECGGRKVVEIALPGEIAPKLNALAGKRAGIMRAGDEYLVRNLSGVRPA